MSDAAPDLDRLQDQLEAVLADQAGISLAELDGYAAGLIVCPDLIPPSEWLPGLWGEEHAFADAAEAEAKVAPVMAHYNRVAQELATRPEAYAPALGVDSDSGEIVWGPWIDGFERAMRLRPEAWAEMALSDDDDVSLSVGMIITLHDFREGRSGLPAAGEEELDRGAPELIPLFVRALNAWTKSRQAGTDGGGSAGFPAGSGFRDPPAFGDKVGRNDP